MSVHYVVLQFQIVQLVHLKLFALHVLQPMSLQMLTEVVVLNQLLQIVLLQVLLFQVNVMHAILDII